MYIFNQIKIYFLSNISFSTNVTKVFTSIIFGQYFKFYERRIKNLHHTVYIQKYIDSQYVDTLNILSNNQSDGQPRFNEFLLTTNTKFVKGYLYNGEYNATDQLFPIADTLCTACEDTSGDCEECGPRCENNNECLLGTDTCGAGWAAVEVLENVVIPCVDTDGKKL